MPPINAVNNCGHDIIIATFPMISFSTNRFTIIELAKKRKMNFIKLAQIIPSQKFLARKEAKTKIKRAFESITKGIIGARTVGKSPMDNAITLGIKPIRIAPRIPKRITEIKSVALTIDPVIIC